MPWIPSPGFWDRCPLAGLKLSKRGSVLAACCLGWRVGQTHFGNLGPLRGQRLEPGGGGAYLSAGITERGLLRSLVVTNYIRLPVIGGENCLPFS